MKKNKGVTLISLVVTIVILFLISTISLKLGTDVYNYIKIENYLAQMKVIQSGVDNFVESNINYSEILQSLPKLNNKKPDFIVDDEVDTEKLNIDINKSWNWELDSIPSNYYYFTAKDLEKYFGLKNQELNVFINLQTRNVISEKGIKENGEKYYRQYDLTDGEQLKK